MSKAPKWTPGPWKVGPVDDTVVTAADGSVVAEIDGDYNQPETWRIMEANARLIATAPELYEALEGLVRYAIAVRHTAGMGKDQSARLERAQAVLVKARGLA